MNAFFNVEHIERTLKSIQETKFECDIIILENPSKYSSEMKSMLSKYKIHSHYICNENIEGNIFHLFCNSYQDLLKQYKYIAMTESDVVLDKGALDEIINLLDETTDDIGLGSIDIHLDTKKYYNLPICQWVPKSTIQNGYVVGNTGFQFIVFKLGFLFSFINAVNNKELCGNIELGDTNFYGISDTNLASFAYKMNKLWIRTVKSKLDHIGWEHYIENNNEYVQLKAMNLKNKKIRHNINVQDYILHLINE